MNVQATVIMARTLNKAIKGNYCIEDVALIKMPRNRAYITVGGGYRDCDIDWKTDTVRVIAVCYKPEMYAATQYVTTGDLNRIFREGMTLDDFTEAFKCEYEI